MHNLGLTQKFCTWIFFAMLFVGCGHVAQSVQEEETPAQLMSEGLQYMDRGHNEAAAEAFQKIKDRYPYSKFAVEAELKLADALFERWLYDEAFDAYSEFERLHPKNPNIPYVIYQRGMCHFEQVSTVDRDQSHTLQAKKEFERLVKKFPDSKYASMASRKTRRCYMNLGEHELYVGHFYYRTKNYGAAVGRYLYILNNYPDLGQYHEALESLSKCRAALTEEEGSK
ncbi:MAG: outer membrane protein assembly factor BamD [Thermodesulfobacteriota bacterium]|nr:outer membrane protein assembly factor BamD [Thermodesulfobacteriota bacterium]